MHDKNSTNLSQVSKGNGRLRPKGDEHCFSFTAVFCFRMWHVDVFRICDMAGRSDTPRPTHMVTFHCTNRAVGRTPRTEGRDVLLRDMLFTAHHLTTCSRPPLHHTVKYLPAIALTLASNASSALDARASQMSRPDGPRRTQDGAALAGDKVSLRWGS